MLVNFLKQINLAEANPPPDNTEDVEPVTDFWENSQCLQCGRILQTQRALVCSRPDFSIQMVPKFVVIHYCSNESCPLFYPLTREIEALEYIPLNNEAGDITAIPVLILIMRETNGQESDNRGNRNFLPPVEE